MSTASVILREETANSLKQIAAEKGTSVTAVAEKAIQHYLRQEAEKKIAREMLIFRERHAELLQKFEGQYIAMHHGEVIDQDSDELALYLRIREDFPSIGILIKQVFPEINEVWHMRSPRFEQS